MKSNAATSDRVGMYYRSLSEAENQTIYRIKEQGQEFLELIDELGESDETRRAKARIEDSHSGILGRWVVPIDKAQRTGE